MEIEEVQKLKLEPGDVLVLKMSPRNLFSSEEVSHLAAAMEKSLGFRPTIVACFDDVDIQVVKLQQDLVARLDALEQRLDLVRVALLPE